MEELSISQSVGRTKFKFVLAVQNKKYDKAMNLAASKLNQFPALIISIDNNNTFLCTALLKIGWDPNEIRRRDGATALHSAVTNRNLEVIALLLSYGAEVAKKDACGSPPISRNLKQRMDATGRNVFRSLAMHMKEEDYRGSNEHGETLLHIASKNNTVPVGIYKFLMEKGIDVNAKDAYTGRNFLMDLIIWCTNEDIIVKVWKLASQSGLDVQQPDSFGTTLLHRLASEEREEVLRWTLENEDIRIRVSNCNGQTAMWLACKRGNMNSLKGLYKMGESFVGSAYAAPGESGQSPFDIASTNQREEVASLVQSYTGEGLNKHKVRDLRWLSKETVREAIAQQGTNIWPKVQRLELPTSLKAYLVEVE